MLGTNSHFREWKVSNIEESRHRAVTQQVTNQEKESSKEEEPHSHNFTEDDLKVFKSSKKKHNPQGISNLVHVDVTPNQRKQLELNQELELTFEQKIMIKSMQVQYNPQRIFCKLPGDDEDFGSKIAKSRIFQFEIQGSKYSKFKPDISKGIFERNMSYFIVVHKGVKNMKSLDLNSNNTIFLWRGEDGLNITKNAIEKFITTPFQEIKIQKGSRADPRNTKKGSMIVSNPTSLMRRSISLNNKFESAASFGMNHNKSSVSCNRNLFHLE